MDLDHLNLPVGDPDACGAFYEEHFGFRRSGRVGDSLLLRNDDGFLLTLAAGEVVVPTDDGMHVGFRVDTVDEVVARRAALAASGVEVTPVQDLRPNEDFVFLRCHDPNGTLVEVFWEP